MNRGIVWIKIVLNRDCLKPEFIELKNFQNVAVHPQCPPRETLRGLLKYFQNVAGTSCNIKDPEETKTPD